MFYCSQCPEGFFATREGLATHCKTSSQWHPYCWKCDINFDDAKRFDKHLLNNHHLYSCFYCSLRFGSEGTMEQHTLAKHGRYQCEVCEKGFETEIGRNRHYRNSSAHLTCSKCGCGCEDHVLLSKHEKDAHPQLACRLCDGRLVYIDELEGHYLESKNHPTCSSCLVGFQDQFSYEEHIDSLHPELQKCSLAYPASTIPEYHSEDPPEYPHPVSGEDSNDMECSHDSRDVDEESVHPASLCDTYSTTEIKCRSDQQWCDYDDECSTSDELQSAYESTTEEEGSEQYLEFSEYRLHTNSPAWAALFPLPDSPEIVTAALHATDSDSLSSSSRKSSTSLGAPSQNDQLEILGSPQILSVQECPTIMVHPYTKSSELDGGVFNSRVDSSSGKTSPVSGSLRFEEYPELPSSPSSLLSSRWSYPNPLEASEALAHHSPLGTSDILSEAPIVASSSTLASALSPQDEIIPFQFSDSIFEEKLSDDGAEADTIWDAVSDNVGQTPLLSRTPVCHPTQFLHCRLCLRESCDDLTATMCGHIFCNSCITQSVIANPQCPVCKAPTLLYSLFRIDLSI